MSRIIEELARFIETNGGPDSVAMHFHFSNGMNFSVSIAPKKLLVIPPEFPDHDPILRVDGVAIETYPDKSLHSKPVYHKDKEYKTIPLPGFESTYSAMIFDPGEIESEPDFSRFGYTFEEAMFNLRFESEEDSEEIKLGWKLSPLILGYPRTKGIIYTGAT